jgi:hypothetical protein
MLKTLSAALLPFLVFFSNAPIDLLVGLNSPVPKSETGIFEKMIVANGTVRLSVDLPRSSGSRSRSTSKSGGLEFDIEPQSFFTVVVFNGELRGPLPGSMKINSVDPAQLPAALNASQANLVVEKVHGDFPFEMVVRDQSTGFIFFYVEGHFFDYDPAGNRFSINEGRLLVSKEYAPQIGRSAGSVIGRIDINATMQPIEITEVINGEVVADVLPAIGENAGTVPGPDVVVGDVYGLAQFGSTSGGQVGLAVGTNSCNYGTVDLNWFALPSNDHPVIPQNLYRMSGGADNTQRFEQIGQSSVKHAFTALTQNLCNLGCNGVGGSRLGSGCSDPYSASLNAGPSLGSRAWINPFTGSFPRGDSATPPNNHSGHSHTGTSHRILTNNTDLDAANNPGATYWAEAQYVTPHEFTWCQQNPGQCNMYNNVSYRQYTVSGANGSYSFSPAAATVRTKPAVAAWPGAEFVEFEPDTGNDGIGTIAYKVSNPSPGVYHYEYAVFNQNMDRAVRAFSVPLSGAAVSNVGFHAPPQHPGWTFDGTDGNQGFSNEPWNWSSSSGSLEWSTDTFAQNPNANAIRWGTMYNFRFESDRPPQNAEATIGFYKTGEPITVQVLAPSGPAVASATVSGRVMSSGGFGVYGARVTISDGSGNVRSAITGPFGFYSFPNVALGGTYTVAVGAKWYTYTPQVVEVNGNISGLDFLPAP